MAKTVTIGSPSLTASDPPTRSCHRSSHRPTQVLPGQGELAVGEAEEARPSGDSGLMRTFRRPRRHLRGRPAAIADRDLASPRSDAVSLGVDSRILLPFVML